VHSFSSKQVTRKYEYSMSLYLSSFFRI